jgi:hypothetical protein
MEDPKTYQRDQDLFLQELDTENLRLRQSEMKSREMALEFLMKQPHFDQWLLAACQHLRIPTKKIIHSELKTITASQGDAVGIIVEQVIVMGQEESGDTVSIISFLRFLRRLLAQSLLEHATGRPSF